MFLFKFIWLCGVLVAARGPLACGTFIPEPGIKPTSPALEDGFLTTGPPGKSLSVLIFKQQQAALSLVNGIRNRNDPESPGVNGNSQTLEPSFKESLSFKKRTNFRKKEVVNINLIILRSRRMNIKESTLNLITRRARVTFEKTFQQLVSFANKISGNLKK